MSDIWRMNPFVKLIECPRDAMQGWPSPIATDAKAAYLQQLLRVGFDTLDCVSFVSPKAIPQMADSAEVLRRLDLSDSQTKLLAIVANLRGAEDAAGFDSITYLGYPFSISPTFQRRNANSTLEESWGRVLAIQELCVKQGKQLVVYISMGFGNPYGDPYDSSVVSTWVERMKLAGIGIVSLADTVGLATAEEVQGLVTATMRDFPDMEIGVHLHSAPHNWQAKLDAAVQAGCRRIDGALKGIGGCPMANDDLVGNMDTLLMTGRLRELGYDTRLDEAELAIAADMASRVFAG